jgi:hypothetical protein
MHKTAIRHLLALLAVALLSGCSTFNRDWKRMAETPPPSQGIEGRWQGKWKSDVTGHTDRLRCIVSKKEENVCLARFHANYKILFRFSYRYTVPLKVEERDGKFHFEGEANLHWYAGGIYRYKGTATPTNLYSTYQSKADHGSFEMLRP